MTNAGLLRQVELGRACLRSAGIGKQDVVALALPSGPETTVAFLTIMASAICAPLNPSFTTKELEYYLGGLGAKAIVLPAGPSPAREVAQALAIPVLSLEPVIAGPAGSFTFGAAESQPSAAACEEAEPDALGLMLYTSGTTSRAKLVPLSHRNLLASARNVAAPLGLTGQDRCLNVMPLFHSHGSLGATWAAIASGGSLVAPAGFSAVDFFDWLADCKPTWVTAVPTLYQAILARAAQQGTERFPSSLRLVRSASSSMPPSVMTAIQDLLGVPLLESYGMTEAGLQIACNPPPPRPRKAGSVGIPFGTAVAIMDAAGRLLPQGEVGEIVVKGDSVFSSYVANPQATAEAFSAGWLRTGDQGQFDADGYLYITGRLKEIINRGGELVAPREIEEVLMAHPTVAEAIAFALPDERLGEDVGAAVVLRVGCDSSEFELRRFLATQLSAFKVPRKILIVSEIPKTAVGKPDRLRAADRLGLSKPDRRFPVVEAIEPPRTELEALLAARWCRSLRVEAIGINQEYFALGGDSLALITMLSDFERLYGVQLDLVDILEGATIAKIAEQIESGSRGGSRRRLFSIKPAGSRSPLFLIGGGPLQKELAELLPRDQPVLSCLIDDYSYMPHPCRLEDIAAEHIRTIRAEQPIGPYCLGGWCKQGVVAYEAARQLVQQGEQVDLVVLFDAICNVHRSRSAANRTALPHLAEKLRFNLELLRSVHLRELPHFMAERGSWILEKLGREAVRTSRKMRGMMGRPVQVTLRDHLLIEEEANGRYYPGEYHGDVILLRPEIRPRRNTADVADGWDRIIKGRLEVHEVPGDHRSMFLSPNVSMTANLLARAMEASHTVQAVMSKPNQRGAPTVVRHPALDESQVVTP